MYQKIRTEKIKSYEYNLGQEKSKEIWKSIINDTSDESKYKKYVSKDFVDKVKLEKLVTEAGKEDDFLLCRGE